MCALQTLSFAAKEKINTELTLMNFFRKIWTVESQVFVLKILVFALVMLMMIGSLNGILILTPIVLTYIELNKKSLSKALGAT